MTSPAADAAMGWRYAALAELETARLRVEIATLHAMVVAMQRRIADLLRQVPAPPAPLTRDYPLTHPARMLDAETAPDPFRNDDI